MAVAIATACLPILNKIFKDIDNDGLDDWIGCKGIDNLEDLGAERIDLDKSLGIKRLIDEDGGLL